MRKRERDSDKLTDIEYYHKLKEKKSDEKNESSWVHMSLSMSS